MVGALDRELEPMDGRDRLEELVLRELETLAREDRETDGAEARALLERPLDTRVFDRVERFEVVTVVVRGEDRLRLDAFTRDRLPVVVRNRGEVRTTGAAADEERPERVTTVFPPRRSPRRS